MSINSALDVPRVLVIVAEPFNFYRGAGITISSLFKGWPMSNIASAYWRDIEPDVSICQNHLQIKGTDFKSAFFEDWVRDFSPDIIYCVVTDLFGIELVNHAATISGAKIALHVYDDWVSTVGIHRRNFLAAQVEQFKIVPQFRKLIDRSSLRIAIGQKMAIEYEKRYGHKFVWFQNAPEPEAWLKYGKESWQVDGTFVFCFTGNMYSRGNLEALIEFARAIGHARTEGVKVSLKIYTTTDNIEAYKTKFGYEGTTLHPTVSDTSDMAMLNGNADALLLPYNFDRKGSKWLGLSMPTKLPTSMLSATPIFVYAPGTSAIAEYFSNNECAYVIPQKSSTEELARQIQAFCNDTELRERMGLRARDIALKELSADSIRPKFRKALNDCVRSNS